MFKAPFSLQGRIRRSEYCISYIIYFILYFIIFGCIGLSVREQEHDIGDTGARILESSMLMLIFSLVMCFFMVPQGVKRCHDLGKSGWYLFVPIFNPFWLLFAEGDINENSYGLSPKEIRNESKNEDYLKREGNAQSKTFSRNVSISRPEIIIEAGQEDDVLYLNAIELINKSEYDKASNLIKTAIVSFPENPQYKRLKIILDQRIGDISVFAEKYAEAEKYFEENKFEQALSIIEKLIENDPHPNNLAFREAILNALNHQNNQDGKFKYVKELVAVNKFDEAKKEILGLLKTESENKSYLDLLRVIEKELFNSNSHEIREYLNAKQYSRAINAAQNALESEAGNAYSFTIYEKEYEKLLYEVEKEISVSAYEEAQAKYSNELYIDAITLIEVSLKYDPNNKSYIEFKNNIDKVVTDDKNRKRRKAIIIACVTIPVLLISAWFLVNYIHDKNAWDKICNADTKEIYSNYIAQNPSGKYVKDAQKALQKINKKDEDDWTLTKVQNTLAAYKKYNSQHKDGNFIADDKEMLDSLYWAVCIRENNKESFNQYLQNVKDGKHIEAAQRSYSALSITDSQVSQSEINEIRSNINSFYSDLYSRNYENLLMHFTPILSSYFGRKNMPKGDVVQSVRKYTESNRIGSERSNIDWATLDVKYLSADMFIVKFNMDYFTKIDYPPAENYYNVNVVIKINRDYKITSYNQSVVSKNTKK